MDDAARALRLLEKARDRVQVCLNDLEAAPFRSVLEPVVRAFEPRIEGSFQPTIVFRDKDGQPADYREKFWVPYTVFLKHHAIMLERIYKGES